MLNDIVGEAFAVHGAHLHAFCWMAKHRRIVDARVEIAIRARDECMATITQVAEKFGRSHAAISQLLKRRTSA